MSEIRTIVTIIFLIVGLTSVLFVGGPRFTGIMGAVLFLFGLIGILLVGGDVTQSPPLLIAHLVIGLFLIVFWFLSSGLRQMREGNNASTGRVARFGASVTVYTGVFIGILVVLNWLAVRHDKRWDVTQEKVYSLSSQSTQAIENLQKPLKITLIKAKNDWQETNDLLKLYVEVNSSKVQVDVIDPRSKPTVLEQLDMKPGEVVHLAYGEDQKISTSKLDQVTEESLTNAIIKLSRGSGKKLYYVIGHGEPEIQGEEAKNPGGLERFAEALKNEQLTLESLVLAQKNEIPSDAAAVFLVAPSKALLPQERETLQKYAESGGSLILMHKFKTSSEVKELSAKFGIEIVESVVIDQVQRLIGGTPATILIQNFGQHAITRPFGKNTMAIFNLSAALRSQAKEGEQANYTDLIQSTATSWGEVNVQKLLDPQDGTAAQEPGDIPGPVTVGMVYDKKLDATQGADKKDQSESPKFDRHARVVAFGDYEWISNQFFDLFGNKDLILNTINWSVGEEGGVSIRPRALKSSGSQDPIPSSEFISLLGWSFILPEVLLVIGLLIWWRRKVVSIA